LGIARSKNGLGQHSFGYFAFAVERKVTRCQSGTPTKKVKTTACSEGQRSTKSSTLIKQTKPPPKSFTISLQYVI